ncbi:MAG: hypothetical protein NDI67_09320 [Sulfuritalea sp.]|nr:hypothetical protein [Sulfuritalea sp.]
MPAMPLAASRSANDIARHCYYCRCKHPPDYPMRRVDTPCGVRWRCRASIEAARLDAAAREAWGRTKSEANRSQARHGADQLNKLLRERKDA